MEMAAILFCCQFEDQDPQIIRSVHKQMFLNRQIAFNHLPNLFEHEMPQRRAKILKNGGHFVLLPI